MDRRRQLQLTNNYVCEIGVNVAAIPAQYPGPFITAFE